MDEVQEIREIDRLIIEQKLEPEDPDDLEYTEFIDDGDTESDESDEDYEIPDYQKSDISKFGTYKPVSILSENEKKLIDMCKDQDLKEMLLLNRQKNFQLIQLFKNIKDQLIECQESITEKEELVKELKCAKRVSNKIWRIGRPYFKTVDNYYCPRNQDVVLKDKRGEILYYDMTTSHKWFKYEIKRLNAGVAFHYKMRRLDELHQTIQEKEKIMISSGQAIDTKEISELKNMIQIISNDNEVVYPPLNYNDAFEWGRIATNFLNDKFTPEDCEIFWNIYLHPNANKDPWTKEENDKLSSLVDKYKSQNWDLIAQELGNNRTAFIALMHYFRNILIPKGGRFTPAEDKLLYELVNVFRRGNYTPWHRVAYHFGGRTRGQLFNRYRYFLSCREGIVRGKFTIAEDILMMILVDRFGRRFSEWKTYFPNRSHVQIKARYTSNVDKALKKGSFTLDEDKKILKHVEEYGTNKWALLVKMLDRCSNQARQRYRTLTAFFKENPDKTIEDAPRRRFYNFAFDKEYDFVRLMADKFKNSPNIPSVHEIEKLLLETPKPKLNAISKMSPRRKRNIILVRDDSEEADIDNFLTEYFSDKLAVPVKKTIQDDTDYITFAKDAVMNALSVLQAELHIPIHFNKNPKLDETDISILNAVVLNASFNKKSKHYVLNRASLNIDRLISPNLYTATGIRNLLLNEEKFRTNMKRAHIFEHLRGAKTQSQVQWCINTYLSNLEEADKNEVLAERTLFFKRFVSLFKFPAIMTLQKPSDNILENSKVWKADMELKVRTYKRNPSKAYLIPEKSPAVSQPSCSKDVLSPIPVKRLKLESHLGLTYVESDPDDPEVPESNSGRDEIPSPSKITALAASPEKPQSSPSQCPLRSKMIDRLKDQINNILKDLKSPVRINNQTKQNSQGSSDKIATTAEDREDLSNKKGLDAIKQVNPGNHINSTQQPIETISVSSQGNLNKGGNVIEDQGNKSQKRDLDELKLDIRLVEGVKTGKCFNPAQQQMKLLKEMSSASSQSNINKAGNVTESEGNKCNKEVVIEIRKPKRFYTRRQQQNSNKNLTNISSENNSDGVENFLLVVSEKKPETTVCKTGSTIDKKRTRRTNSRNKQDLDIDDGSIKGDRVRPPRRSYSQQKRKKARKATLYISSDSDSEGVDDLEENVSYKKEPKVGKKESRRTKGNIKKDLDFVCNENGSIERERPRTRAYLSQQRKLEQEQINMCNKNNTDVIENISERTKQQERVAEMNPEQSSDEFLRVMIEHVPESQAEGHVEYQNEEITEDHPEQSSDIVLCEKERAGEHVPENRAEENVEYQNVRITEMHPEQSSDVVLCEKEPAGEIEHVSENQAEGHVEYQNEGITEDHPEQLSDTVLCEKERAGELGNVPENQAEEDVEYQNVRNTEMHPEQSSDVVLCEKEPAGEIEHVPESQAEGHFEYQNEEITEDHPEQSTDIVLCEKAVDTKTVTRANECVKQDLDDIDAINAILEVERDNIDEFDIL